MNRRSFLGFTAGLLAAVVGRRVKYPPVAHPGTPIPVSGSEFDIPYTIVTDDPGSTAASVYGSGCLPARLAPYPTNSDFTVRRISLTKEPRNPHVWRAAVRYSSAPLGQHEITEAIRYSEQSNTIAALKKMNDINTEQLAALKRLTANLKSLNQHG